MSTSLNNSIGNVDNNNMDNIDTKSANHESNEGQQNIQQNKSDNQIEDVMTANIKYGTPIHINKHKKNEQEHDYLRVVSWNVNMETLSAYCPFEWQENNNKWDKIYQQVNEQDADIITFQEIPNPFYQKIDYHKIHPLIRKYYNTKQWFISNSTQSHCGHTLILVNKRIQNKYSIHFDSSYKWPAVILYKKIVSSDTNDNQDYQYDYKKSVMLFGVHLMYGNNGSTQRMLDFDRLYKCAKDRNMNNNFVIIGDTNMRYYDEKNVLNKYKHKGVTSCWNLIDPEHLKLNDFMATFYRNFFQRGKQGTTRYDKIFCGRNICCISFGIFDKCVSKEPFHFLSDHRGIFSDIEIK